MPKKQILKFDTARHEVFVNGKQVNLTTRQYLTFAALHDTNRTLSRRQILERIWEGEESWEKNLKTVDQHIKCIRQRLRERAPGKEFIVAVRGLGYKIARF